MSVIDDNFLCLSVRDFIRYTNYIIFPHTDQYGCLLFIPNTCVIWKRLIGAALYYIITVCTVHEITVCDAYVTAKVVCMGGPLLFLYQLCQCSGQWWYQADAQQLHVSTGTPCCGLPYCYSVTDDNCIMYSLTYVYHCRLSISAVVMSYLQNPQPMTPPWSNI